jgi:peptidyl-prolyl cis-trans isomerase SurA
MRNTLIIIFIVALTFYSCTSQNSKIVLAEFGDYQIHLDEFEKAYLKNSGSVENAKQSTFEDRKNFLDLYVNYRLKLRDAEVRGYTKDADMLKEYDDYRKTIGNALIVENKLYKPGIEKLHERRKYELRASHIFLIEDTVYTDDEKLKALGKQLIDRLNNGDNFEALAKQYSYDKYTKDIGGDVYYFTAGAIPTQIEDACYATEVGKVYPELVQSSFGYHVIKITDKILRKPAITAQHILVTFKDSTDHADTAKALAKIKDIEQQIINGADFGVMALKYSEDPGSANKKGDLGPFSRGRMVKEFDEVAFKLNVNEVSAPVKSPFGFHLIKVTSIEPSPSLEMEKEELKQIYQRTRFNADNSAYIASLKDELNFQINQSVFDEIVAKNDTLKLGYKETDLFNEFKNKIIFSTKVENVTADTLFFFMSTQGMANAPLNANSLKSGIEQFAQHALINQKAMIYHLENKEFANLLDEYKNGMYLFKILEEEVWGKVLVDSTMIQNYYDKNKENFRWKDRVEFKEIYVQSDSLIKFIHSELDNGIEFDSLYAEYNKRTGYENKMGYFGLVEVDVNELSKNANLIENIGDYSKPFPFQDGWSIVKLVNKEGARIKYAVECQAEIASRLQESESKRYEAEYLDGLKRINKPKYYYNELSKAFEN